jgi:hypothetical protein
VTLTEYLEWRSGGRGQVALSRGEAALLGIPYPLKPKWQHRHGSMALTDEVAVRLKEIYRKAMFASARRGVR